MAQFTLPKIGDGTGGTVAVGNAQLATASNTELAEILDHFGKKVAQLTPRKRMLFIAVDAALQQWSFSDSPNTFPAVDVDPPGSGGGPHATTHQNGGLDEINIAALSGLLADPQAPLSHAHVIADTTGLQTVLDGKADDAHSHVIADTTGLQAALDAKAAASHTHAIGDTTGLQAALDGKAASSHTHAQADVTGLVAALAGKSDVGHTHAASEVSSGVLDTARLGSGTPDSTKFLRGDQTWAVPPAGGSTPTGTGFRHVTAGVEDAASKLVDTADINNGQVTLAKLANIATSRLLGRITAGAGVPEELTPTQVTALLDAFTSALKGLVPASGGGTTNFLRADGTWNAPSGGGGSSKSWIRADVDRTLPNDTNVNALFNNPTNGRLTLATGVYRFRGIFIVTGMSATSGNALINILGAGTATIGSWLWKISGLDNSTPSTIGDDDAAYFQVGVSAASALVAGTGTAMRFEVFGTFECTVAGTMIPSIDLVTAAAAVVQDGSFFEVERLGDVNTVSLGAWD